MYVFFYKVKSADKNTVILKKILQTLVNFAISYFSYVHAWAIRLPNLSFLHTFGNHSYKIIYQISIFYIDLVT